MKLIAMTAALALAAGAAAAQQQGDPEAGRKMAEETCSRCHDVKPGGAFKEYPPSFASIAVYRSEEQIISRIFFPPFHASMPEFGGLMVPAEVYDLTAYIMSLEKSVEP